MKIRYPRIGNEKIHSCRWFDKKFRKMFCPECLTNKSDNIIRLRDGLFECRKCGALWIK
jgi:ribosomal protein L37AE/L43A